MTYRGNEFPEEMRSGPADTTPSVGPAGKVAAILLAGGSGRRMGAGRNKLFLELEGRPILGWTLEAFQRAVAVDRIILVLGENDQDLWRELAGSLSLDKVTAVVTGGQERSDSAARGLRALSGDEEIVLLHDGARPLVSPELISQVVGAARRYGSAVPGCPVKETIKQVTPATPFSSRGEPSETTALLSFPGPAEAPFLAELTLPRDRLWAVQTPQGFRREIILRAYEKAGYLEAKSAADQGGAAGRGRDATNGNVDLASDHGRMPFGYTDDASLVEALGLPVCLIPGEEENIKITTRLDLELAEMLLRRRHPGRLEIGLW